MTKHYYITIAKIVKRGGLPPVFSNLSQSENYTGRKRPRYTTNTILSMVAH